MPIVKEIDYVAILDDDGFGDESYTKFYDLPQKIKKYLEKDGDFEVDDNIYRSQHYKILKRHGLIKIVDNIVKAINTGLIKAKILRAILQRIGDSRYKVLPISNDPIVVDNNVKNIILQYLEVLSNLRKGRKILDCSDIARIKRMVIELDAKEKLLNIVFKCPKLLKRMFNLKLTITEKNDNSIGIELKTEKLGDFEIVRVIVIYK